MLELDREVGGKPHQIISVMLWCHLQLLGSLAAKNVIYWGRNSSTALPNVWDLKRWRRMEQKRRECKLDCLLEDTSPTPSSPLSFYSNSVIVGNSSTLLDKRGGSTGILLVLVSQIVTCGQISLILPALVLSGEPSGSLGICMGNELEHKMETKTLTSPLLQIPASSKCLPNWGWCKDFWQPTLRLKKCAHNFFLPA